MMNDLTARVIDFWFADMTGNRPEWFKNDQAFDNQIREKFIDDIEIALAGGHGDMAENQLGCLALIILLDQFPRNLFRDTGRAFAGDERALSLAKDALGRGFDQNLQVFQKAFFYLPFEHSENLDDQIRCIELFKAAGDDDLVKWAVAHHDIIARFGRFPHRNKALGRDSSDEEIAFLKQPDSSF